MARFGASARLDDAGGRIGQSQKVNPHFGQI
jgi:hypothetical protein